MKKLRIFLIIFFSLASILYAQNFKGQAQELSIAPPEKKLTVGETSIYSVEWLGIPVGKIILKVEGIEDIKGYKCYHVSAQAFPNNYLRRLYDIEYKVHTYIDTQFFFTRRFEKTRRVNKDYNYTVIDFDQENNKAVFTSRGSAGHLKISPLRSKIESRVPITSKIPYGTQDLLSSFYYFRLSDIKEGHSYPVNIYYNQRNWPVDIKVDKPFLREVRKKGSFPVVKVFPDSGLNDYILGRHQLIVHLTADSRRIPMEFSLSTALGPIHAVAQGSAAVKDGKI